MLLWQEICTIICAVTNCKNMSLELVWKGQEQKNFSVVWKWWVLLLHLPLQLLKSSSCLLTVTWRIWQQISNKNIGWEMNDCFICYLKELVAEWVDWRLCEKVKTLMYRDEEKDIFRQWCTLLCVSPCPHSLRLFDFLLHLSFLKATVFLGLPKHEYFGLSVCLCQSIQVLAAGRKLAAYLFGSLQMNCCHGSYVILLPCPRYSAQRRLERSI